MTEQLSKLFFQAFRCNPDEIRPLQAHASERNIYRLLGTGRSLIGIENSNTLENDAFIGFAKHFKSYGLVVPEIFAVSEDRKSYLEEDFGDITLYAALSESRTAEDPFPSIIEKKYVEVLQTLPRFQIEAAKTFDYSKCYPVQSFTVDSIRWDLNFFCESFLAKLSLSFSQASLEQDFKLLLEHLAQAPAEYFMYRDFQSRNIMVHNDTVAFIDFQSGRKGPLQYDVASILYQASAQIPDEARKRLVKIYVEAVNQYQKLSEEEFRQYFGGFTLVRMLQVLGTYGKQGIENRKEYFLNAIPSAVSNIAALAVNDPIFNTLPQLQSICYDLPKYVERIK